MSDLACALHVHSRHSNGGGTIAEIAAAASQAALDVVLVTDHDTLAGRGEEGWYGDVLVLVGVELSPKRRDHYLAFGLDSVPDHEAMTAAEMCATVAAEGGFGFAAHPFSTGSQMPVARRLAQPQAWADLDSPCITGIEVWNVESDGAERARNPGELLRFARDPLSEHGEPSAEALATWDRLATRRRVVGVAGLDAHHKSLRLARRALSPLPYARLFRHVRTHVQTEATPSGVLDYDRTLVFDALRAGRCYMAIDALAPAHGFSFEAVGDGGTVAMGAEAPAGPYVLNAELPTAADVAVVRDGQRIHEQTTDLLALPIEEPGVYRVEARADGSVWILSNPIYLR